MSIISTTSRQLTSKTWINSDDIWVRPSEWPSLTPVTTTESKFTGLLAIMPNDADNLASFRFLVSGGGGSQYTVDWGDGTTEDVDHNTQVTHQYTYSTITGDPLSYGYKTVTVIVTPKTSGQTFTSIILRVRPDGVGAQIAYAHKWLDIEMGSTGLTTLTTGANNSISNFPFCERFRLASKSASLTSFFEQFYYWSALQEIIFDCDTSTVTNCNAMFYFCTNLRFGPYFNTENVTITTFMFGECRKLVNIPTYNLAKNTTMALMFVNCQKLPEVPIFNTSNVTSLSSTFNGCFLLKSIPEIDAIKITTMDSAFRDCYSLETIKIINSANCTSYNSAFSSCRNLNNVSITGNPTSNINLTNMFANCTMLTNIELFDTNRATTFNQMFFQCTSLQKLPPINAGGAGNATILTNFAAGCFNLSDVSGLTNTENITTFIQTFQGCRMLTISPNVSTNSATSVSSMFRDTGLTGLKDYNFSNVAAGGGSFIQAGSGLGTSTPLMYSNIQGLRFTHTYVNCGINKENLEYAFANVGAAGAASQVITITNNPGADTALSKTSTWTNTSNVITMANTVGVSVGTQITGANIANALAVTVNSNNTVSLASYIDNDTYIAFANVQTTNLAANTRYWVSNRAESGGTYFYELAPSEGGNTITFTSGTANMLVNRIVTTVNTNANVEISAWPSGNGTNATATTRNLNTNIATFRGFGITG